MIPSHRFHQRAYYTDDGHIVIRSDDVAPVEEDSGIEKSRNTEDVIAASSAAACAFTPWDAAIESHIKVPVQSDDRTAQSPAPEERSLPVRHKLCSAASAAMQSLSQHGATLAEQTHIAVKNVSDSVITLSSSILAESVRQYAASAKDSLQIGKKFYRGGRSFFKILVAFLSQPVLLPGRNPTLKQRSRGMLFFRDILGFGLTFATIFSLLFVSLNYESFWEIARARMEPLNHANLLSTDTVQNELEDILSSSTKSDTPGLASGNGLFSYVPPVGPPQTQLIIPKLKLSAPIVFPGNEELARQDWKALEERIQEGLETGVVHYPGTTEPGKAGNVFLTGHSSYYPWAPGQYKTIFARLGDLNVGDEYWVYFKGDKHRYVVVERKEVRPTEVSVLDQPQDARMSTLMTCWPIGTTLRRMIISAQEVDSLTGAPLAVGEHGTQEVLPRMNVELLPI